MGTRTGNFKIGFRRGWSEWQKSLPNLLSWAKQAGFDGVDLGGTTAADVQAVAEAGLALGSVDLLDFSQLLATDPGVRKEKIARTIANLEEVSKVGAKVFFCCVLPGDNARPRAENYKLAVESFAPIAAAADQVGVKIAIEGYPGSWPYYSALCCTPETCRHLLKDIGAASLGFNYDPSHLIRLGVDHVRFLKEFAPRVWHVHGKDTEIFPEHCYEYGLYQGSVFNKNMGYGEQAWRYALPGHGCARWKEILKTLKNADFKGMISVELEDQNFNGSEDGEKAGLSHSLAFLKGV